MIAARILADSRNPYGVRLTSWLLTYPRFIHSEFLTHRVFSRNAASSRAIPFKKMVQSIEAGAATPERWAKEKSGMQGGDGIETADFCVAEWLNSRYNAINSAKALHGAGLHKSICNRLIEPWSHITVLATATDHANFFALRAHPAAMPEFQVLAYRMLDLYLSVTPSDLEWGQWHMPDFWSGEHFQRSVDPTNPQNIDRETELKITTARCARLSYMTHEGEFSIQKDIELHDRLAESGHMSPFEHCAQAIDFESGKCGKFEAYPWSNFDRYTYSKETGAAIEASGWGQYRKLLEGENNTTADLTAVMATKPDWITL